MKFKGIYIPNVTPFNKNGKIVFEYLGELTEYWIKTGISGIVVNASTGEAPYLNQVERLELIEYIIEKADDRINVIVGTGTTGTRETIELTMDAKNVGAKAALVATPYFYQPSNKEIITYFTDIMEKVDLPLILYNVPKFTGYSVNPKVIFEINKECSNLSGVKDSSGNPGTMAEIIRLCGNDISCLSGSADMILPTLMLGGKGAIVAVANVIPELCMNLYNSF
ncbi:MAG: dihydrodipicolinate synthase family protein, partial [Promethearchaeota archaeon]